MASSSRNDSENTLVPPSKYPGERMGLPQTGPRSVGRFGRRLVAIILDWVIASALITLLTGANYFTLLLASLDAQDAYKLNDSALNLESVQMSNLALTAHQTMVFFLFIALQILGIWILKGSLGHRIMGMYVVDVLGRKLAWWRPIVRTVLLVLVIPALVWDSDQRGFHDKVAGTILLRAK